ncbi:hypothetical protein SLEP1_g20799 [Rubroshorea leprosula]|uniref:RRM domain-containing protein n=1 Tax=Rubroshorea leprosula TaxID=152421 RepID=A0AAV5J3T9_9ROSI|nr:hypothetical protein SLEP1_g20799 [Rubroshorea leprosula]
MEFVRGDRRRLGNGKAATGFKDFANRLPAYDQGLLKQCVSYHFINFPEDWGAKELFYFIRKTVKAGRLWDIFIPSKRDRRGNRYGFARFLDVREEQEMKKQLESIRIGNKRVIFNPAVEKGEEKRRWQAKSAEEVRRKSSKKRTSYEESTKDEEENRKAPKMTYAQSLLQQKEKANISDIDLKGPTPSEARNYRRISSRAMAKATAPGEFKYKKVIEIKGTEETEENLMKCAVGVALSPSIISNLPEIFFNEGFPSIKITPMGGNLVLIQEEYPECIKELVDGNLQWVSAYFEKIKYWSPTDIAEERFVWVRIQGLPLHAWTEESISTIGNHVGKSVKVDEHTISKECLDAARVLVSTKSKTGINEEFLLKVKNNSYNITLVEENWRADPWWLNKIDNSSVDSEVSSTAFNFGDDSGEMDGNFSNGQEEEEIQTHFKNVNGINYPDKLCVSKIVVEGCKDNGDVLSNHIQGKQREERANGSHTSLSRTPASDEGVVPETAQSKSPPASKNKAHSAEGKSEADQQEECGLKMLNSPVKSPRIPDEMRTETTMLVTGTRRGRRRRAVIQLVSLDDTSPRGSISDSDIMCNNKRIKEGLVLNEAKKMLEFGGNLGIEISNREEQIVERFSQMEERDRRGQARQQ